MKQGRSLALGAAFAIAISGAAVAAPAFAVDDDQAAKIIAAPVVEADDEAGAAEAAAAENDGSGAWDEGTAAEGSSDDAAADDDATGGDGADDEAGGTGEQPPALKPAEHGKRSAKISGSQPVEDQNAIGVTIDGYEVLGGIYTGPVSELSGAGTPGRTISVEVMHITFDGFLSGNLNDFLTAYDYETVVDADGTWRLSLDPALRRGLIGANALQLDENGESDWSDSASFSGVFTEPVTVDSIADGQEFELEDAPSTITGTVDEFLASGLDELIDNGPTATAAPLARGFAGSVPGILAAEPAEGSVFRLSAELAGKTYPVQVAADGSWSFDLEAPLPVGDYALDLTQSLTSQEMQQFVRLEGTTVEFSVVEADAGSDSGGSKADGDADGDDANAATDGKQANAGSDAQSSADGAKQTEQRLASTGATTQWGAAVALALGLVGGGALIASRRKRA